MRVGGRGRRRRRHRTLHDIYEQLCTDNNKMEKPICTEIGEDDIMTTTSASRNNSNLKRYWTVIASSALFAFMIPVTCGAMLPAWETQPSSAGKLLLLLMMMIMLSRAKYFILLMSVKYSRDLSPRVVMIIMRCSGSWCQGRGHVMR